MHIVGKLHTYLLSNFTSRRISWAFRGGPKSNNKSRWEVEGSNEGDLRWYRAQSHLRAAAKRRFPGGLAAMLDDKFLVFELVHAATRIGLTTVQPSC